MRRIGLFVLALVAPALPAAAAVYTVGAGGSHATIQSALDAALAAGDPAAEIRVHEGTYPEHLVIAAGAALGTLRLEGGWNATFTSARSGATRTVVDAGGTGRGLLLGGANPGALQITDMTFRNGRVASSTGRALGGNLRLFADDTAVTLRDCHVEAGAVLGSATPPDSTGSGGGGLAADLSGKASLVLDNVIFADNLAEVTAGPAAAVGGGALISLNGATELVVEASEFHGNRVVASGASLSANGGGVRVDAHDHSGVSWVGGIVADNQGDAAPGAGGIFLFDGESRGRIRELPVVANRGAGSTQLQLAASGDADLVATDILVVEGEGSGAAVEVRDAGRIAVTNWTVALNLETGGGFFAGLGSPDHLSVYNSIFWHNGYDLYADPGIATGANLTGDVDPLFVDETGSDYILGHGSPAIDAGDDLPPGGLGSGDVAGNRRVQGDHVDIGAYETAAEPVPICRVLDFPVLADANVCLCARDEGLAHNRCTFRLPDLVLVARFPRNFGPGDPIPVRWSILPWAPLGTGPYSMSAAAEIDGQWQPQLWLGPTAPRLENDQLVVEPFRVRPGFAAETPLRTRLTYQRRDKSWVTTELEILLPAPIAPPQ